MSDLGDIPQATKNCISSLERCLAIKPLMRESWAENRLAEMNLWASNLGVLADNEASLNQRLQSQTTSRLVSITLLLILHDLVENAINHALNQASGKIVTDDIPVFEEELEEEELEEEELEEELEEETLDSTFGNNSDYESWFDLLDPRSEGSSAGSSSLEGSEPNEDPLEGTLKNAMKDVDEILYQLIHLGLAIRRPGTASRLRKADGSFNQENNETGGKC